MQTLRSFLTTHRPSWLVGCLALLVGLGGGFLLRSCQAQPATPERAAPQTLSWTYATAPPTPGAAVAAAPTLTWTYASAAPDHFVIRRSIDGGTWADVAKLPGARGTGLTWEDTTLPTSEEPVQVRYTVYAVVGTGTQARWSEASNVAVTTVGEEPPVLLGECVAQKRGKKKVIITCSQP